MWTALAKKLKRASSSRCKRTGQWPCLLCPSVLRSLRALLATSARGVIVGLTRHTNKGHLARAALEATAFQTREVVEAMEKDSQIRIAVLRTDGGMVENNLLMQFQADILNIPVVRPAVKETTALGAAYAAGLATGFYSNIEDLRANWAVDRTWNPRMDEKARESLFKSWKKSVTRSFDWVEYRARVTERVREE